MNRWILTVAWFFVQFVWCLLTKTSSAPDQTFAYRCLWGLSYMTAPVQIMASIIALVIIWRRMWKRKPLAERVQEPKDDADV